MVIKQFIVICPYCNNITQMELNMKKGDKHIAKYVCPSCGANVAAHNCNLAPMGLPADKELRKLRYETHKVFDDFASLQNLSKKQSYEWLATKLKIPMNKAHIGSLTYDQCVKLKKLLEKSLRKDCTFLTYS